MSPQRDSSRGETERSIVDNGETIGQPSMSVGGRSALDGATAAYGVLRDDAIWVTECAWCERVRTPAGDWKTPTASIHAAMGVQRTHGICPRCARIAVARADRTDERSP